MRKLAAEPLPPDSQCPKGYVVGAAWVERAVRFADLREEFRCGKECDGPGNDLRHVDSCTFSRESRIGSASGTFQALSPHAGGPICNILSAALRLKTPVPCAGEIGCWRLPESVREKVAAQLDGIDIKLFREAKESLPRPWPLSWDPTLPREAVRWHRDMLPERGTSKGKSGQPNLPADGGTSKSSTLRDFFRTQAKEAPAQESGGNVKRAKRQATLSQTVDRQPGCSIVTIDLDSPEPACQQG
ncbi:abfD, partial [Symbiodinium pilosum]